LYKALGEDQEMAMFSRDGKARAGSVQELRGRLASLNPKRMSGRKSRNWSKARQGKAGTQKNEIQSRGKPRPLFPLKKWLLTHPRNLRSSHLEEYHNNQHRTTLHHRSHLYKVPNKTSTPIINMDAPILHVHDITTAPKLHRHTTGDYRGKEREIPKKELTTTETKHTHSHIIHPKPTL